jgi:hypothetical protein
LELGCVLSLIELDIIVLISCLLDGCIWSYLLSYFVMILWVHCLWLIGNHLIMA